ncbi:MAG: acyltransferase domain-containing protein [Candidatus Aminicenantes bacterium]|nr:acyltransferase domain-containing protein [Candidatus Aminicenantes bacterium]
MRKRPVNKEKNSLDIAVIGMAGRFPGAANLEEFWRNLQEGRETISRFSREELEEAGINRQILENKSYIRAKGIIKDIDCFDAEFFSCPPREAIRMDPQIRILHECAWEAFEKAGYCPPNFKGRVGVYLGANANQEWLKHLAGSEVHPLELYDSFLLNYRDYVSTRISFKLDLKGPSVTLLSACSTSLVTIHLARQALLNDECDMALAGGVSLSHPQKCGYLYQEGLMVSSDGHCRAFDAAADGTVFGDGVGTVLLKPLRKAWQDGDNILAVIKGSAVNNDGNGKVGFTAPSVEGQKQVLRAAYAASSIAPETIGYIETHGTGTKLGDAVEIKALKEAFEGALKGECPIGSVKSNIGHVNIAAGVSSFIKTVLILQHKKIPPSLHFKRANPNMKMGESPFFVNTELRSWVTNGYPRRAAVSAFGFGGTNAHMILEEAPVRRKTKSKRSRQILLLSAKTEPALKRMAGELADHFKSHPSLELADAAYTLSTGRGQFGCRTMFLAEHIKEASNSLTSLKTAFVPENKKTGVCFMFPGQGAQYPGMGEALYRCEPEFRKIIDECAEVLKKHLGGDIRSILYPPAENRGDADQMLTRTMFAQPAVFVLSYAVAKLWESWGIRPGVLIGHSIGEFTAACLAGVFSLEDALYLVSQRGILMEKLLPGDMLAVPLSEKEVEPYLGEQIALAAVNGPELCVLSGPKDSVAKVKDDLQAKRIASRYLQTSHAFHSSMMKPVLKRFTELSAGIAHKPPLIPILSTVTGGWLSDEEAVNPSYWTRNLRNTVRFSAAIRKILKEREDILLEVGPGRTLTNLARAHISRIGTHSVFFSIKGIQEKITDEEVIYSTLGKLWMAGAPVDWKAFYKHEKRKRVSLPTYSFEKKRFWADPDKPGYGKSRWEMLSKNQDISGWFAVPSWRRSVVPYFRLEKKTAQYCWLVFTDSCGVGAGIVQRLKAKKQNVFIVRAGEHYEKMSADTFVINPSSRRDYEAVFKELGNGNQLPQWIIHLWSVTEEPAEDNKPERVERSLNRGFFSLLFLAQVIGMHNITEEIRLAVISNNIQEVTGEENVEADKAPVLGTVKVIPQEYPNVSCCSIDLESLSRDPRDARELTDCVLAEVVANFTDLLVAYRGGHRWIQHYEPVRIPGFIRGKPLFRKKGVYLITGGLGGIGLELSEFLSRRCNARLILTGRSPFPPRSQWENWLREHEKKDGIRRKIEKIQKIEAAGGRVFILSADVTDFKKMRDGLSRVTRHTGRVNGVIHAAGLPGEGIIQLKNTGSAWNILASKVKGTLVLEKVLKGADLDFFFLFSSIASILGGIGLVDYCAANSFLDAYTKSLSRKNKGLVMAVNWDMWGEVGMGLKTRMPQELQGWLEKELRDGITTREGVEVFRRLASWRKAKNVVVSTRDLQARIDMWIKREFIREKEALVQNESSGPQYMRPSLSTEFLPPVTDMEKKVAGIWGRLFGIEKVGRDDNFYELGGHSLLATTLVNMLKREFDASLSIQDILDNPTVAALAILVEGNRKDET